MLGSILSTRTGRAASIRSLVAEMATSWALAEGPSPAGQSVYCKQKRGGRRAMLEERIRVGQVERLDEFHARELGCGVELLRQPGVHLLASERRGRPGWGGYTVPVLALSTPQGGIVSCRAELLDALVGELS